MLYSLIPWGGGGEYPPFPPPCMKPCGMWYANCSCFPSFCVKFVIHLDHHPYVILAPPHGLLEHTTQVQLILVALIECIAQNSATRETVSLIELVVTRWIYTHR